MADHQVDLLVIGAGASGASVAYEATRRGLSVALLEAGDVGGGTSCRSTKLLHGGVRYLELAFKTLDLAQLRLVREALFERSHWLAQAPFLARRLELALPTQQLWGQAYYRLGLGMYDALAGQRSIGHSRLLSKQQLRQALPLLRECQGGVAYSDGQFDDARLNLLLALTAEHHGALLKTRCRVVGFEKNPAGQLTTAITENAAGEQQRWEASVFINATGIASDTIRTLADPEASPRIITSRGTHIVLKEQLCNDNIGLLIPSTADGRVLFVLPFYGHTLVGTTDVPCEASTATKPSPEEENYLLQYVKNYFPSLVQPRISSRWAGGRPLLKPKGDPLESSRLVREHEIETLGCGLVSVLGGKWTTCRPIAQDALSAVAQHANRTLQTTHAIHLLGSSSRPQDMAEQLHRQRETLREHLPRTELLEKQINHLQSNFGLNAVSIIKNRTMQELTPLSEVIPLCRAEITHAIQSEHALNSSDVLTRRCRLSMIDQNEADRLTPVVDELCSEALNTSM